MANFNGSLEAVDCDIHSVRYDVVLERSAGAAEAPPKMASSGHLRRCVDTDMTIHNLSHAKDASILS